MAALLYVHATITYTNTIGNDDNQNLLESKPLNHRYSKTQTVRLVITYWYLCPFKIDSKSIVSLVADCYIQTLLTLTTTYWQTNLTATWASCCLYVVHLLPVWIHVWWWVIWSAVPSLEHLDCTCFKFSKHSPISRDTKVKQNWSCVPILY